MTRKTQPAALLVVLLLLPWIRSLMAPVVRPITEHLTPSHPILQLFAVQALLQQLLVLVLGVGLVLEWAEDQLLLAVLTRLVNKSRCVSINREMFVMGIVAKQ